MTRLSPVGAGDPSHAEYRGSFRLEKRIRAGGATDITQLIISLGPSVSQSHKPNNHGIFR
jgi:hypothetical protein